MYVFFIIIFSSSSHRIVRNQRRVSQLVQKQETGINGTNGNNDRQLPPKPAPKKIVVKTYSNSPNVNTSQGMRKPSFSSQSSQINSNNLTTSSNSNNNSDRSPSPMRNVYPMQRPPPPQNENPKNTLNVQPTENEKTSQIPPPPPPPPKPNNTSNDNHNNGNNLAKSEPIPVINSNANNSINEQSFSPKSRDNKSEKSSWWPFKKKRSSMYYIIT